jgi:hypothetical protein
MDFTTPPPADVIAGMPVTDEGRRLSDAVTLAVSIGGAGRWVAARLSDGGTDGTVYDTRTDAVRHQLHEDQCCYLMIPPTGMPPQEATAYLKFNRARVAAGMKMVDPESAGPIPLMLPTFQNRASRRAALRRNR